MDENKVRFGLKNVHVGSLKNDNGIVTFGAPKKYPGAVNFTMDPEGEETPFYADDTVYYTTSSNNGYTGELEVAVLYNWFEKEYLGAEETNEGMLLEDANSKYSPMFLMFQFDGDKNATKHILYNVQCSRPSIEGGTKEDSVEPNTTTIPFTAMPLQTETRNIVKAKVPASASNYNTFFEIAPTVPTFPVVETPTDNGEA